jgi:hypothetical protein
VGRIDVKPGTLFTPVVSDVVLDILHYENVSQDFVTTAKVGIAAVVLQRQRVIGQRLVDFVLDPVA